MKELLAKYLQHECTEGETQLILKYFGFSDNEEELKKAILYCLDTQDEHAALPVPERLYHQLKKGIWRNAGNKKSSGILSKKIPTEYLLVALLICLFFVLMFFLFNDKIQYDKTWKSSAPPPAPVENISR